MGKALAVALAMFGVAVAMVPGRCESRPEDGWEWNTSMRKWIWIGCSEPNMDTKPTGDPT